MVSCRKLNVIINNCIWSFGQQFFCISLLNWVDLWKTNLDIGDEFNYVIWVTYGLNGSKRWLGMWHFTSSFFEQGWLESHLNRLYVSHVFFLKEMCEIVCQGIKPSHFSPNLSTRKCRIEIPIDMILLPTKVFYYLIYSHNGLLSP